MKWPIILFSIPFAAVLFGVVMVASTIYFPDDVVADDYYKDGMAINQQIRADELAKLLELNADLWISKSNLVVQADRVIDDAIRISFHHVTDRSQDRSFLLPRTSSGGYSLATNVDSLQVAGIWYLKIEGTDQAWRLKKRIRTPFEMIEVKHHE